MRSHRDPQEVLQADPSAEIFKAERSGNYNDGKTSKKAAQNGPLYKR